MTGSLTCLPSYAELYPGLHCPPLWGTPRDLSRATLGPAVGAVAASLRVPPMPHQQLIYDVSHEIDPDTGELAYDEVIVVGPRQATGKTALTLPVMVHRAVGQLAVTVDGRGEERPLPQRILYTAQTSDEAKKKWHDHHLLTLQASPYRSLFTSRERLQFEAIMWRNGSMHSPVATTGKTGGTGDTTDLGVIDEAWVHESTAAEQALRPTMMTRRSPQLWIVSMVPGPERAKKMKGRAGHLGRFLRSKVEAARAGLEAGINTGTALFFWGAARGADPADPATWYTSLPALCPGGRRPCRCDPEGRWAHTVFESTVRKDQAKMAPLDFGAEYLSWWPDEVGSRRWQVVSEREWEDLTRPGEVMAGRVALGVWVNQERSWAAIGAAGSRSRRPGWLLEVTGDRHGVDYRRGTTWLLPRLKDLDERHEPVVIVTNDRALADEAETAGLVVVRRAQPGDVQAASGMMFDGLREGGGVRHLGQPVLTRAASVVVKRMVGHTAFVLEPADQDDDAAPLGAVSLALWGLRTPRVHVERPVAAGRPRMRWM